MGLLAQTSSRMRREPPREHPAASRIETEGSSMIRTLAAFALAAAALTGALAPAQGEPKKDFKI